MKCPHHAAHGAHGAHGVETTAMVKQGVIATGAHLGKALLSRASKHPVIMVGLGFAIGYYLHSQRGQKQDAQD